MNNSKGLMAGDIAIGLGSPHYISALDEDVSHFERRNDSTMREMFLTSQPYDDHSLLPKVDHFQSEGHFPTQFRPKGLHLDSGDAQHTSRFKHHTTLPLLPQLITKNLDSAVDTAVLLGSNMGCAPEPNSTTTTSSCGDSPYREIKHWPDGGKDSQNDHSPRARKARREKPRIQLAPDQPPTTQGKPRSRVYVACIQWYVNC
jgi:hypothetical protein